MADLNDVLSGALAAYREQDLDAATAALDQVLAARPNHADALNLRGLVAGRRGQNELAIQYFDRAIRADPEHAGAWSNRARPLAARGDLHEAERSLSRAMSLSPAGPTALLHGRVLLALDRPAEAIGALSKALGAGVINAIAPLVYALLTTGRRDDALGLVDRLPALPPAERMSLAAALRDHGLAASGLALLAASPDRSDELNLRGTLRQAMGDLDGARQDFAAAVHLDPNSGPARHNLASALFAAGSPDEAVPHHLEALSADPDDHSRWVGFIDTIGRCHRVPAGAADTVAEGLARPFVAHQSLERAARHLVQDELGEGGLDAPVRTLAAALDRPLVHRWWRRTRVLGPAWERALTALRRAHLLDDALAGHADLALSLATQAWHTGFAWWESADESAALDGLSPQADPVKWAMYRPLADGSSAPEPLVRLHLTEPEEARRRGAALPTIGLTTNPVSQRVQAQYEAHPYPRLLSVHRKPALPLPALLASALPHVTDVPDGQSLRVLIAGCGTGQQILGAACRYAGARILAVDLSRASLGVAASKVAEWGFEGQVRLAQADILALDELDEAFDLIECGGVLHHLDDPEAGWRVLRDRLAPGGLMKIAVYSEHARADVVAAQAVVADLPITEQGLREARRRLLDLPENHAARSVVWSVDFASLAGFRDLVRHECEHRFTLERLGESLQNLGLELLGFQHPDPRAAAHYRQRFPEDAEQVNLQRWAIIEQEHPETFVGMLQFWCRRT